MQKPSQNRLLTWLICLGLALGVLVSYSSVFWCGFINYDDPDYVTHNPHVMRGLTAEDASWAFSTMHAGNWHPLTWISHMADCQLYGLRAVGHHLTSLLLHTANCLLLFLLLARLTGALWRSGLVAALFAWHPLHVESVAWISERKDVLSAFFWLLAVIAYARYVSESKVEDTKFGPADAKISIDIPNQKSKIKNQKYSYLFSLFFFALGLLAKPMVVTLPFVLLLLDYWPLRRTADLNPSPGAETWPKLVLEKAPYFLLAAASSVITFVAQKSGGAVSSLHQVGLARRLENAPIAYARYLRKAFWPADLAIFYPLPGSWPLWQVIAAALLLIGITFFVVAVRRSRPCFLVGWFWFLGMLVPVIGVVQVGLQSMADRYTYLPLTGVFVMLVWGGADLLGSLPYLGGPIKAGEVPDAAQAATTRPSLPASPWTIVGVAMLLSSCLLLTRSQVRTWRDAVTLFSHALAVDSANTVAHVNLADALADSGNGEKAKAEYDAALRLNPGNAIALLGLGRLASRQTNDDQAIEYFSEALQSRPDYPEARYNLGRLLAAKGRSAEAISQYRECLRLEPDIPEVHYCLANALVTEGNLDEAAAHYRISARLDPDAAGVRNNLGVVLLRLGRPAEAVEQFQAALRLQPGFAEAEDQLGVALQKLGRLDEAKNHFAEAVRLQPDLVHARLKLGLLLASQSRFDAAKIQLQRVTELQPTNDVAWYNLAGVFEAQSNWVEAARDFGKVIELAPGDADAHARRGAALAHAGQQSAAIAEYERAVELTNRHEPLILLALAEAYASTGRFEDAIASVQKAEAAATARPDLAQEAARRLDRYRAGKP